MVVAAPKDSPRLRYVLDWVLRERLGLDYRLVDSRSPETVPHISYGTETPGSIFIPGDGLLYETGTRTYDPETNGWQESRSFSFDVLSGIFFLLSRYEEYGAFEKDVHGRYPHTASILFRKGLLETPVVDIWVQQLGERLQQQFSLNIKKPAFRFRPSYDIDIAYSYLHKGTRRTAGGLFRDLLRRPAGVNARLKVLSGRRSDPYDSFAFLRELHETYRLEPLYFILSAMQPSAFDKNIDPRHPSMPALVKGFAAEGLTGMHPSYYSSEEPARFAAERQWLEATTGQPVMRSRQHYIRLFFPRTYRLLLQQDIRDDYSMGYSTHTGFRAGTSHSFSWYDLEQEQVTTLRVHPFCFMDTTAHYDMGLGVAAAFDRLQQLHGELRRLGGTLIPVFHNFSLGTDPEWKGWPVAYRDFLGSVISG